MRALIGKSLILTNQQEPMKKGPSSTLRTTFNAQGRDYEAFHVYREVNHEIAPLSDMCKLVPYERATNTSVAKTCRFSWFINIHVGTPQLQIKN